jgi:hypothetical protein
MYPTVCTLIGLWRYAIAQGVAWRDCTAETRTLLANVDLAALQTQGLWRTLATLVRVVPDGDIFSVRAKYDPKGPATIGANRLTWPDGLWFTLADCIASKLLTGKAPHIVEALIYAIPTARKIHRQGLRRPIKQC